MFLTVSTIKLGNAPAAQLVPVNARYCSYVIAR